MKILYVTPIANDYNGGSIGRDANKMALNHITSSKVDIFPINIKNNIVSKITSVLFNFKCGLSYSITKKIIKKIKTQHYDVLFFDTSLYGHAHKAIKHHCPKIKILTFFHNCEYIIYQQAIEKKSVFYKKLLLRSVAYNEKKSLLHSDSCIFLTKRDSQTCTSVYQISPKHTAFTPIALQDTYLNSNNLTNKSPSNLLFVGSYFYPNIHGLVWFCNEVLPNINYKLTIIGKYFDKYEFTSQIKDHSKVSFLGFVEKLDEAYEQNDIVIQPIFKGSGMKTKTAECFMHGKPLVSTEEGLVGYKYQDLENVYHCESKEDYITTLANLKLKKLPSYDKELKKRFNELYSIDSRANTFYKTINEVSK